MFLYVKEVGLPSLFLTKVNYFLGNPSALRPVALVGSLNEF